MDKYLKKMKKCFFIKNIENEAKEISLPFGTDWEKEDLTFIFIPHIIKWNKRFHIKPNAMKVFSRWLFSYRERESPAVSFPGFRWFLNFPPELPLWSNSRRWRKLRVKQTRGARDLFMGNWVVPRIFRPFYKGRFFYCPYLDLRGGRRIIWSF